MLEWNKMSNHQNLSLMFVSLQFKLEMKKEDKGKLINLMRKQSSAIRVAYNMLRD
jgi:hypothetical protein